MTKQVSKIPKAKPAPTAHGEIATCETSPSAFSTELAGKYSGFEEIDLVDYLAVRDRAVRPELEAGT